MAAHRPLPQNVSFPKLEEEVLERWRERDVFKESMRRREGAEPFVFYEGPPTANGRPGSHHVLARVFKDIFPRYQTMRGRYVERKAGWDCHGLPVEIAVEQQLGFTSKADIERYGIAEFNQKCRESVFEFLDDWTRLTERIGYWVDLEHPYRTLDNSYVESVWWALAQLWERDLLYEGHKVVPYCPRDGTALSSHEVAQGYKDVEDPSVYVKFPVVEPAGALREGDVLLIWTTTPWTLVSNAAVAVDPDLPYVRTTDGYVLAEALVARVLGEDAQVADRFHGRDMLGARYEPPFPYIPGSEYGEKGHTVLPGDFVTAEDGTGIVHTAIAFGEDDFRLGAEQGLNVINPVRPDGTYDERIGPYAGRWVKEADPDLIEDLRSRGRLLRAESYLHAYPHCWRCGTPLLYYAKPSWYIRTSQLRDRLLAANDTVDWHPEHIKTGRFGKWLENNVDWALSRERYWGTPLPIWRCENGHATAIGAFADLEARTGRTLEDPHRPYVDDMTFDCEQCGSEMRRVPEVIDVWFDSGAMPFAQHHAPFENQELFEARFPADYICEAIDQTRGWFYSLIAISTLLFDRSPYRTVLCPRPHRRRRGQEDVEVAGQHRPAVGGARAPRGRRVPLVLPDLQAAVGGLPLLGRRRRRVAAPVPAAALEHLPASTSSTRTSTASRATSPPSPPTDLDRWALSRLAATVETVTERLDAYDATRAGAGARGVRRRPLQLVRAALAPALLGRRPRRLRDPAHVPGDGLAAARAVLPVRGRRDLRQPRRRRAERAPDRLAARPAAAIARSRRRWRSCARPCASASPRAASRS